MSSTHPPFLSLVQFFYSMSHFLTYYKIYYIIIYYASLLNCKLHKDKDLSIFLFTFISKFLAQGRHSINTHWMSKWNTTLATTKFHCSSLWQQSLIKLPLLTISNSSQSSLHKPPPPHVSLQNVHSLFSCNVPAVAKIPILHTSCFAEQVHRTQLWSQELPAL